LTVLPDHEITSDLIEPFRADRVQPASVDLLLDDEFRIFEHATTRYVDLSDSESHANLTKLVPAHPDFGFILHPGEFVLAGTQEIVRLPRHIMARVEGKSSLGRLGLIVHATAGFIDPGFEGQITLEMTNLLRVPIILRPGMPICQISFSYMNAPVDNPYKGRYQGQRGVTASRFSE
jgi:dCTP deaminase